ncbi:MAG: hypothetical protein GY943_17995 [Chloroflexi bacterium]|nr:hypothetical protein [Chloroflexota bacterium]
MRVSLCLIGVCTFLLVACGQNHIPPTATPIPQPTNTPPPLSGNDFSSVCTAEGIPHISAYEPDSGTNTVHQVIIFEGIPLMEAFMGFIEMAPGTVDLPKEWVVSHGGVYENVELVLCMERATSLFVERCQYVSDETSDLYALDVYDASYDVFLREAQSGKVLAQTTMQSEPANCPLVYLFRNEEHVRYATPSDEDLHAFLEPFVMFEGR